jgi:uncharacterized protein (DUF305 family)
MTLRENKFCNLRDKSGINDRPRNKGIFLLGLLVLALLAWPQESRDPQWQELTHAMGKMHAAMASAIPSGDSDVDFVRMMLPHHQAAIDMAKSELLNGKDPQMRRLAQEIITDQQSEIDLMQLWLKRHGRTAQKESH